jgi:hypothetical protein
MGLQVNSLLLAFGGLAIIVNPPRGAASVSGTMEEKAATLAFVSPETPDATLRPNLSPFPRIQMARRVDRRNDLITSLVAAVGEF